MSNACPAEVGGRRWEAERRPEHSWQVPEGTPPELFLENLPVPGPLHPHLGKDAPGLSLQTLLLLPVPPPPPPAPTVPSCVRLGVLAGSGGMSKIKDTAEVEAGSDRGGN